MVKCPKCGEELGKKEEAALLGEIARDFFDRILNDVMASIEKSYGPKANNKVEVIPWRQ